MAAPTASPSRSISATPTSRPLQDLARQVFEAFPCPLLLVEFRRDRAGWHIGGLKLGSIHKLHEQQEDQFANALDGFSRRVWLKPGRREKYRFDLAILHDPKEAFPPSDAKALKNFVRVGKHLGLDVELIEKKDYARLGEFDALFIRETTAIDHHTYRFAKKAESEGLVVMDDPRSILRCTNKVYLADLLRAHKLDMPATEILYKDNPGQLEDLGERLGFPLVLKIPDAPFPAASSRSRTRRSCARPAPNCSNARCCCWPRSSSTPNTTGASAC